MKQIRLQQERPRSIPNSPECSRCRLSRIGRCSLVHLMGNIVYPPKPRLNKRWLDHVLSIKANFGYVVNNPPIPYASQFSCITEMNLPSQIMSAQRCENLVQFDTCSHPPGSTSVVSSLALRLPTKPSSWATPMAGTAFLLRSCAVLVATKSSRKLNSM
jgi:hypothetical protein